MAEHRRFPGSVYRRGSEPDARFSLANERTFLAWVSAGLALISVGVGLGSLGLGLQPGFRTAAAVVLVLGGIACPVQAWFGWARVETALREQRPLPSPTLAPALAAVVALAGLFVLLGMVVP
jgi:putative membrane protein